ncbi:PAS domain S-box protein [uncultured Flavobacterium sp.]|uniref:PAS domain S-box protein n=1 Tax=uncultured Flavobacterium sp. TaxID=165435 RepID=UPI0030EC03C0|tara:strand:+ start:1239 stop:5948 length:4710 start_codon:yes stop_codon:yes gene_type:complete
MKIKNLELLDLKKIDSLLKGFNSTTGLSTAILDIDGAVVSQFEWRKLTTQFYSSNPETSDWFNNSTIDFSENKAFYIFKNPNGLCEIALPIMFDGIHFANLFSGPFLEQQPDVTFLTKEAKHYGFNVKAYVDAIELLPVVSLEKIKDSICFLNETLHFSIEMAFEKMSHNESIEALISRSHFFENIIDNSPALIYVADIEGKLKLVNKEFEKKLRVQKSEIVGKNRLDIMPKVIADQHRANDLKVIQLKQPIIIEEENIEADGTHIYISQKFPLYNDMGQVQAIVGVSTDISEMKKIKEALTKSENKYKSLFEDSADGIFVVNEQSNILELNNKICEILNYSKEELILLNANDIIHSDDLKNKDYANALEILLQGNTIYTQYRLRRKDGNYIDAELSIKKISEGQFLNIIRDVTQRKLAEKALLEREKLLSVIFNNHTDLQLLINITNEKEFLVEAINNPFNITASKFGITLDNDEIIGKSIHNLFQTIGLSNEYYDKSIATYNEVIRKEKSISFSETISISGHIYNSEITLSPIMNENGKCQYVLYNSHNITEQTIVNNALIESEIKFKQIFLTSPDFVTLTLIKDGIYVNVNDNYLNVTGYSREEIIGKTADELNISIDEDDKVHLYAEIEEFGKVENLEVKLFLPNGRIINGLISASVLLINDAPHLFAITRDITNIKQAKKRIQEREKILSVIFNNHNDLQLLLNFDNKGDFIVDTINKPYIETAKLYGITLDLDAIIGKPVNVLNEVLGLGDHYYDITIAKYKEVAKTGKSLKFNESIEVFGKTYTSEVTISSILNDEGKCQYILYNSHNITEQTIASESLKESEEKFKQIFLTSPDFVTISNIEDKKYIDVNENFLQKSGYTREEIIGKTSIEINIWHNPEDRNRMLSLLNENGYVENMKARFILKNGNVIDGLLSAGLFKINNEQHILTITRDITKLKQAEQDLKETVANLRSMIDNRQDSIYSIDRDFNYIIFNNTFEKFINNKYNIQLKKGMSLIENLTEEETNFWVPKFESVFKGESDTFEFTFEINNEVQYFQTTLNPIIEDHIIIGASGISIDITARKLVEEALKLSEEKFKKSFQLSPFLITLSTYEGQVIEVNDRIYETLGYTRDEFIARNAIDNPLWVDIKERQKFVDLLKRDEYVSAREVLFHKKSGEIGVFSWSACIIELDGIKTCLTIVYDITERKQVEEALKVSEEKFKKSFQLSPFLVTLSTLEGQIIDVNDRIFSTLGYTKEEFLTLNAIEHPLWVNPEDRVKFINLLKNNEHINEKETQLIKKSGEISVFSLSASVIELNGRKMYLGIIHDISERKNAEQEIIKLNSELELKVKKRTAQLEAINKELETFSYSVSHDLKAPLRGIDGYSKLLLDTYKPDLNEESQTFIKNIRTSTLQMNQIIDDLLDYSRLERSQLQIAKIKIKDLIESVLSIYTLELEAGYFKIDNKIEDIEIFADKKGVIIAIRNLIENAIKFTKEKDNPTIKIEIEETESSWIISVNDNGIGFDMQYHHKIFNIFQRLQRSEDFPGTGIGLALVSKAMQRMQGKAWAKSIPNVGSTFYLEIPKN